MNSAVVGRPRDPRVDASLREHLVQMLAERGPDGFSVDELASRSQVSKAAIYRRYSCRDDLILAGFEAVNESMPDVSDLGVRQGLIRLLEWVREAVATGMTGTWVVAMQQRPQLRELYMTNVVAPRRRAIGDVIHRGQQRGLIAADANLDVLLTCLSAPAVIMGMHRGGPHPSAGVALDDVVDTVMAGVLSPKARASGW